MRSDVETTLTTQALATLHRAGVPTGPGGVEIAFEGRDANLRGLRPPDHSDARVLDYVRAGLGVRVARGHLDVRPVPPPPKPVVAPSAEVRRCEQEIKAVLTGRTISFYSGSARLTTAGQGVVDEIGTILVGCAAATARVIGHTDGEGSGPYNLDLSQNRAATVVSALVGRGIAAHRIVAEGRGEAEPVGDNSTAGGRAANRRIVFELGG